jgi:hypothetical protein
MYIGRDIVSAFRRRKEFDCLGTLLLHLHVFVALLYNNYIMPRSPSELVIMERRSTSYSLSTARPRDACD